MQNMCGHDHTPRIPISGRAMSEELTIHLLDSRPYRPFNTRCGRDLTGSIKHTWHSVELFIKIDAGLLPSIPRSLCHICKDTLTGLDYLNAVEL